MNSCESYQELISRLVDGEISHDEHEALMAHMKTCSRCNAMYAVFHDLSDILSEESEKLPEGLHENIMAGVRRSDIIRKNRRMRKLGLRTALAAAACLVLVLFAASGLMPDLRAQDITVRSEEALAPIPEAPSATVEPVYMPAPIPETAAPVQVAPPSQTAAPVQDEAQAAPGAYLAAGDSTENQYNTPQPSGEYIYQPAIPEEYYYETPAQVYTPTPVYTQAPVYTSEPEFTFAAVQNAAPEPAETEEPLSLESNALRRSAYSAPPDPETEASAPSEAEEEEPMNMFSLFVSDEEVFEAPEGDEPWELGDDETSILKAEPEDAGIEAVEPEETEEPEGKPAAKNADEQRLTIRGKEARGRLLALLGGNEEALPEAELTRVVHLTLVPEDEYGGEEKLDVLVYGDFVFYRLFAAEGGSTCYRASCSLAELDGFLKNLASIPTPTPAPTPDPYADAEPA